MCVREKVFDNNINFLDRNILLCMCSVISQVHFGRFSFSSKLSIFH